ncbi:MAG: hypothetical protein RLZZ444_1751, partial [Pseudomonadota bacterium]
ILVAIGRPASNHSEKAQAPGANAGRRGPQGPPVVVVAAVEEGRVNDRLSAIGDGDAIRSVAVTPLVSGQIAEILVKPGQKLAAGDVIARLDDAVEKIALERSKVALQSAEDKLTRNEGLKKIISQADLQDAQTTVETARLAVAEAELNLARRTIRAPIAGIAGIVNADAGDYVTVSSTIVTIDDRSKLLVDFWVPERFSPLLAEGQTIEATAIARPDKSHQGRIVAIDNRIDAASRTMRVQAEIGNEDDSLRAGQGFEVALALPGDHYPSVSPLAIQWDSQGAYVWRLKDQKVERVAVKIMARNPDSVLVSGELEKGQEVVVEGLQRLRNGIEVKLFGSEPTKTEADKTASVPGKTKGAAAAPGAAQ